MSNLRHPADYPPWLLPTLEDTLARLGPVIAVPRAAGCGNDRAAHHWERIANDTAIKIGSVRYESLDAAAAEQGVLRATIRQWLRHGRATITGD